MCMASFVAFSIFFCPAVINNSTTHLSYFCINSFYSTHCFYKEEKKCNLIYLDDVALIYFSYLHLAPIGLIKFAKGFQPFTLVWFMALRKALVVTWLHILDWEAANQEQRTYTPSSDLTMLCLWYEESIVWETIIGVTTGGLRGAIAPPLE